MAFTRSNDFINSSDIGVTFGKGKSSLKKKSEPGLTSVTVSAVTVPFRRSLSEPDDNGDYVNLDKYRSEAGIKDDGESTESVSVIGSTNMYIRSFYIMYT